HLVRVHVPGQRQLHQDAVDGRVAVERVDAFKQLGLGEVGRVLLPDRMQAGLLAGGDLVAHVDLRGGVIAHQHDRQAGTYALGRQRLHALGDFFANALRQGGAVDDACGHAWASGLARATFIRSATVVTSSFSMMLARCASTVLMLMPRSSAICLFKRPATMRSSTCDSRPVSLDSSASRLAACWWPAKASRAWSSMRSTTLSKSSSTRSEEHTSELQSR